MSGSSLASVVSGLVRASMGGSVPKTVPEDDVDRYVAELILKEAKQKAERYSAQGIRAYLPQVESNAPKTNKRFLSSIIRSTDDHNKTILRAQAQAAQEVRMEREEEERRERRERAEEAVAAERARRTMGRVSESWASNWDGGRKREKEREREKKRDRSPDEEEERPGRPDRKRRRHHHRHRSPSSDRYSQGRDDERHSRSPERRSRREHEHERSRRGRRRSSIGHGGDKRTRLRRDDDDNHVRRSSRRHSRSPHRARSSPEGHQSRRRRRSSSHSTTNDNQDEESAQEVKRNCPPEPSEADLRESELRSRLKAEASQAASSRKPLSRSSTPELESRRRRSSPKDSTSSSQTAVGPSTPSRSPSSTPPSYVPAQSNLPSKMDKYFVESYDPRLDVAPLTVPKIPATGLISDAEFEGWDAMLELIRLRREDKEEKKMLERLGISTKDLKGKDKKKTSDKWDSGGGTSSIMDIEYKKKGSVREWDLGKEGL